MKIKPKDIIWEITNQCNKNCKYCGSKGIINCGPDASLNEIDKIITEIISVEPNVVTISGGEPGSVVERTIGAAKKFKAAGIKAVSIVSNGHNHRNFIRCADIDALGISINSAEDIDHWDDLMSCNKDDDINLHKEFGPDGKITVITNFGKHNICEFYTIASFIKRNNCMWQIQLTNGEFLLKSSEIKFLYNLIRKEILPEKYCGVVLADNLQIKHECDAGISSIGITYDGYVISCLSKRSWGNIEKNKDHNLLNNKLKYIWSSRLFNEERFGCADCCRTGIEYPADIDSEYIPVIKYREIETTYTPIELHPTITSDKKPFNNEQILLYGVYNLHPFDTIYPEIDRQPSVYTYSVVNPLDYTLTTGSLNDSIKK
jgi:MoaA/NifB/PqqE/SkfB family radical SAM enzyme